MQRTIVMLAALVVVAAPVAEAQAPQPSAEHKRLGYFVGRWAAEGELKSGPMGPGGKFTAADTCEWFEGGFSVVCRSEGRMPTGPARSIGILGYSAEEKVYTYYGVDNSGMTMASVAKGTLQGDTWTYTDESTMGGAKVKSRVTIKELSPTAYSFRMEFQAPDGKWLPVMESKNTKAPS
ncbi:MAG TPA: DUF1579 family protein [Gemmatimonadales bacterium]|jgi:hypothetical protein|nr:DUF1579 family protein [Gemmatimonadales bacterium]